MAAARSVASAVNKAYPMVPGGLSTTWVSGRKHQLPEINAGLGEWSRKWKLFLYSQHEFCKVGLLKHDTLATDEFEMARLAKARMTQEQQNAMYFRLNRALLLSATKKNLPPEEWTPIDAEHLYLEDVIAQLEKEVYEKKLYKSAMNDYDDNWERISLIPFRIANYMAIRRARKEFAEKFSASVV